MGNFKIYFGAHTVQICWWNSFNLACEPFWTPSVIFEHSLTFWHNTMFRSILYFPSPDPGIGQFSKEPWFLSGRMIYRNRDLDVRCAYCYWSAAAPRLRQQTELETTCKSIAMYTYIHICIYTYFYVCTYWSPWAHTNNSNSKLPPQHSFWFSPFHFCNYFLWSEKSGSSYPRYT